MPEQFETETFFPVRVRQSQEVAGLAASGIRHHKIHASIGRQGHIDQPLRGGRITQIGRAHGSLPAAFANFGPYP